MPRYCTSCLEEFEDRVETCPDCGALTAATREEARELAATRPPPEPEPEPLPSDDSDEHAILVEGRELAQTLCDVLLASRLPCYAEPCTLHEGHDDLWRLAVPRELSGHAAAVLLGRRKMVVPRRREGIPEAVYVSREEATAEEQTPAPLAAPPDALVRNPARAAETLVELLDTEVDEHFNEAARRLLALGPASLPPLVRLLGERASEVPEVATIRALAVLGQLGEHAAPAELEALTRSPDPFVRRDAARAVGLLGAQAHGELMVALLQDSDADVRAEAIDALWRETRATEGFDADASEAERAEPVQRWRTRLGLA